MTRLKAHVQTRVLASRCEDYDLHDPTANTRLLISHEDINALELMGHYPNVSDKTF